MVPKNGKKLKFVFSKASGFYLQLGQQRTLKYFFSVTLDLFSSVGNFPNFFIIINLDLGPDTYAERACICECNQCFGFRLTEFQTLFRFRSRLCQIRIQSRSGYFSDHFGLTGYGFCSGSNFTDPADSGTTQDPDPKHCPRHFFQANNVDDLILNPETSCETFS